MDSIVNKEKKYIEEPPLVEGDHNFGTITEKISSIVESKPPKGWLIGFLFSLSYL